jgi:hypothetical protein
MTETTQDQFVCNEALGWLGAMPKPSPDSHCGFCQRAGYSTNLQTFVLVEEILFAISLVIVALQLQTLL